MHTQITKTTLFLVAALLPLALGVLLTLSAQATISPALNDTQPTPPDGLSADEWSSIQQKMLAAQYQFTWQTRDGQWAYRAPNRVQGFSVALAADGLQAQGHKRDGAVAWEFGLALTGYGEPDSLNAQRTRVEYRWQVLNEWYENRPKGVKHRLTLAAPPPGIDRSQVELPFVLYGNLQPHLDASGQALRLQDAHGSTVLLYDQLRVHDATGRQLPATLSLSPSQLSITVDAAVAAYPLAVDSLLHSETVTPRAPDTPSAVSASALYSETTILHASDAQAFDMFGVAVSIDGDTLVVGAYGENGGADDPLGSSGAAYVFERDLGGADNWGETAILRASDAQAVDNFGYSVSISGDTLVVGAYGENGGAGNPLSDAGAAYVFERDLGGADNWGEATILHASDAQANDWFGAAVSIDGDTLVVGAYLEDGGAGDPAANAGAAYVFERDLGGADNWGEARILRASDAQADDYFGGAVSISGDTLVVGARWEDGGTGSLVINGGAAYVFERDLGGADNWGEAAILRASDAQVFDWFGRSVSIDGSTLVVGALWEDGGAGNPLSDAGAAYVFERDLGGADNWGEAAILHASDAQISDEFGVAVSISGDALVVGAWYEDGGAGDPAADAGAAYVFERDLGGADNWGERAILRASDAQADDQFGYTVSIASGTLAVGAYQEDGGAGDPAAYAGAAYIFELFAADLTIVKSAASPSSGPGPAISALPGQTITYSLAFSNTGTWTAFGVVISDVVPVSLTVQSVISSGVSITETTLAAPTYTFAVQNLAPEQGGVISITGILGQPLAAGPFTNTVFISGTTMISSSQAMVTVQNIAPVADDDAFEVNKDSSDNALDVLNGDSDVNGDALTVSAVGTPNQGGAAVDNDTDILYTPAADFAGTETFTYTVSDGVGGSDTAVVTVTVNGINDAPVAGDDAYSTPYETTLSVLAATGVLSNDLDVEGDPLTASLGSGPSSGDLALSADGSFVYTPTASFSGDDVFTYIASDGALTDTATVTITVSSAVNTAPVGVDDAYDTPYETTLTVLAATGVLSNDLDAEGDPLTASLGSGPSNGDLALSADGSFVYTPTASFSGDDAFTYVVSDGELTDTATVTITVSSAVNTAPVGVDDAYNTPYETTLTVLAATGVLSNDLDAEGDPLMASLGSGPSSGDLALSADGSFVYTPTAGFSGDDVFTYIASDGALTDTATVTITVGSEGNTAPVGVDDAYDTPYETTLTVLAATGVLSNDLDAEGDPLTASLGSGPSNGDLALSADGSFVYTPTASFSGDDAFTYVVSDGELDDDTATVTITVSSAVNTAPTISDISDQGMIMNTVLGPVSFTIGDAETAPNDLALSSASSNPTLVSETDISFGGSGADRSMTITPMTGISGTATITITVSDGNLSAYDVFVLTVSPYRVYLPLVVRD